MNSAKDGKTLLEEAGADPSLDELLRRVPPLDEKTRKHLILHLRMERETWDPKQ